MLTYTGIGSRNTPDEILEKMFVIGEELARAGWCLRSGYADGADRAFSDGASTVPNARMEIFLPWGRFNGAPTNHPAFIYGDRHTLLVQAAAEKLAKFVHPAWHNCSVGAKKLHTRNVYQVYGANLDKVSDMVICWTRNGETVGGTATAIRLALRAGIPIFNLGNTDALDEACAFANRLTTKPLNP